MSVYQTSIPLIYRNNSEIFLKISPLVLCWREHQHCKWAEKSEALLSRTACSTISCVRRIAIRCSVWLIYSLRWSGFRGITLSSWSDGTSRTIVLGSRSISTWTSGLALCPIGSWLGCRRRFFYRMLLCCQLIRKLDLIYELTCIGR